MPRARFAKLSNNLDALLMPPFKGAPFVAWIGFVLFFAFSQSSGLWQGNLQDPDDYLYLTQAIDALKGHGWFDLIQHRMNPPDGTLVHYSHLLSGLYAAVIFLLQPFTDTAHAAIITAVIIPPLYFAAFLFTMRNIAQIMIDKKWGDLTAFFLFFSPSLMSQFMPGHIDHHGLVALLTMASFGCITRMMMQRASYMWAVAAGALLALGLVLGLELIAVLCLLTIGVGLWAMTVGGDATYKSLIFAGSLFATSLVLLAITHAPAHILDTDIVAYSIVYVIMTACFALCFLGVAAAAKTRSALPRYVIGLGLACITGAFFLRNFPALKAGPYGGMDPSLAKLIFAAAPEAWPIIRLGMGCDKIILLLAEPLMAIAAGLFMLRHVKDQRHRWLWGITVLIIAASTGFAAFYQSRFLYYVQAFSILPLTAMIRHDWTSRSKNIWRNARIAVILLIGPISMPFAASYNDDYSNTPGITLPSGQAATGCDMHALAALLDDPRGLGQSPQTIINTINEGSELLFRTPHMVLAGPYHTNLSGNLDAMRFFITRDAEEAKSIAARRNATLVVLCALPSQMLIYKAASSGSDAATPILAQQLINGVYPDWLKPVPIPSPDNLMLFKIQP